MHGFIQSNLKLNSAHQFLRHALEILDWGARVWNNVPRGDRGAIFDETFIRGVRRLYLILLMEVSMDLLPKMGHSTNV